MRSSRFYLRRSSFLLWSSSLSWLALCLVFTPAVMLAQPIPVNHITDAIVYSINEPLRDDRGIEVARRAGSEVLIRAWFKWHEALDEAPLARVVPQAHALGALFGGGITCSALYERENGLTDDQVRDMATRNPAGQLVDAWNTPGCRHGTLSNPKYVDYLLGWCYRQIDRGVDCLFMDERSAALQRNEGFDDYSNADFRRYLQTDPRWNELLKSDLADRSIAPDGTLATFNYRAYLTRHGLLNDPHAPRNLLAQPWAQWRRQRDDRVWKQMTQALRAYAAAQGRRIYLSGNGLDRYVDFQMLGVWGLWRVKEGRVDFSANQLPDWAAAVRTGRALAGSRVPVVFFHDWGFSGFPWMKVTPAERTLWNRIRGAEIYAAGAFYAFPLQGPSHCDAGADGTLDEIAHQAAFYRRHRDLYLHADLRSVDSATTTQPLLSVSLWSRDHPPALIVHVINRQVVDLKLQPRRHVAIDLPLATVPRSLRTLSPDWEGERPATAEKIGDAIRLTLPHLDAYAVAILDYNTIPVLKLAGDRIVPQKRWERPARNEFRVDRNGMVDRPDELPGMLQGRLHADLANPPTFMVNAQGPCQLGVQVQAVATLGARMEGLLDGAPVTTIDLPDLDHKNDSGALEYDRVIEIPIPSGRHRVMLRNTGGDWAALGWYRFSGTLADW